MADVKKNWFDATQKNSVNNTDRILVHDGEGSKIVEVSLIKGSDNVTNEYVELNGNDGNLYRVFVDSEGNTKTIKSEAFTSTLPSESSNIEDKYQALIINQMWGGGDALTGTSVSHSFIELYNLSNKELNLRGLYLWYKSGTSAWESLELKGIIPAYSSFLVRGAEHNSIYKDDCRLKIKHYDQLFVDNNGSAKKFASNGMSVYISIGNTTPITNPLRSTVDLSGVETKQPAYVDLMGCGGVEKTTHTVSAYEKNYRFGMSKDCACRRIDFYNGGTALDISGYSNGLGDSASDCEIINYKTCDVEKYRPRTVKDGHWDMFVSKEPINENTPNTFVLGYGESDTTRTFTWQSKLMKEGYVRYREVGTNSWIKIKSTTSVLQHPDCTVSKHSCIIKNFIYGKKYEYQVGTEGYWSDTEVFSVVDKSSSPIKILWMSDEQSWIEDEINAFRNVFDGICNNWHSESQVENIKMSEFDYILETGDISQNGRRRHEYSLYFDALQGYNKKLPIMSTMG